MLLTAETFLALPAMASPRFHDDELNSARTFIELEVQVLLHIGFSSWGS
jgi:hypothetical protein